MYIHMCDFIPRLSVTFGSIFFEHLSICVVPYYQVSNIFHICNFVLNCSFWSSFYFVQLHILL